MLKNKPITDNKIKATSVQQLTITPVAPLRSYADFDHKVPVTISDSLNFQPISNTKGSAATLLRTAPISAIATTSKRAQHRHIKITIPGIKSRRQENLLLFSG